VLTTLGAFALAAAVGGSLQLLAYLLDRPRMSAPVTAAAALAAIAAFACAYVALALVSPGAAPPSAEGG
jgi:hypothetical protein